MSWRSSSTTNEGLVANLYKNRLIRSDAAREAMLKVDRAHFCPILPYEDSPQTIGYDATISAPHIHASACEELVGHLGPGKRALDVGSGSGYLTAVLAHLVSPGGKVIGVEHIAQLGQQSLRNLAKSPDHQEMVRSGTIRIVTADGRLGFPEEAPFDVIHVGAAADSMPQALIDQLKAPGRMFVPVRESGGQFIWLVDKDAAGNVTKEKQYGVLYVPLTDAKKYGSLHFEE